MEEILIALIGGGGIGAKSALIIKFLTDHFVDEYDPTIEDGYKTHCVVDNLPLILYALDTAGQEEYSAMRDQYMRVCQGFLVGYAITSRSSFEEVDIFIEQVKRVKDADKVPMVLVGNKCDLEYERQVTTGEGELCALRYGIPYFETSAKTGHNIRECIEELIRQVRLEKLRIASHTKTPKKGFFAKLLSNSNSQSNVFDPYLYVPSLARNYIDRSDSFWHETKAGSIQANTKPSDGFKDWLLQNDMLELHTMMSKLELESAEDVSNTVLSMTKEELAEYEMYPSVQNKFREAMEQWKACQNSNVNY